ncbi:hypothetical protein Lesp02_25030 [Lentzea sp. NBRC 105346]|uniref:type VII secretion target n=1 Tax=Lentzea sp. NBRC 105346 TaxID=3032205 RepID=UPI0025541D1B|nr:hypothetical protein [Lentzea sp. NBRC 105346]GLZ30314.1 hypothetical protein Lesp02_25030 [Lentzea sp. NBRC 105346]
MSTQGLQVDLDALATYASTASGLSGDVGTVGTSTLTGVTSLPGDAFGKIGEEVGIGSAFQQAAQRQLDGIREVSQGLSNLGTAVAKAREAYIAQEEQHAADIGRAYKV